MNKLEKVPIKIEELLSKIEEYCKYRGYVLNTQIKKDKHILKILHRNLPGYLEIYCKKSGLTIDGSKGKNVGFNEDLIQFIYEVVQGKEAKEERVTYKSLDFEAYNSIIKKITNYIDKNSNLSLKENDRTNYIETTISNIKSKEKVTMHYYLNKTLYMFGYSIYLFDEISNIINAVEYKSSRTTVSTLDKYVHSSNEKYVVLDRFECTKCINECDGDCSEYLYRLHFGEKIDYSCKRVSFFYVAKYIYRYASEVYNILDLHEMRLMSFSTLNVLSIGCGPATELIGVNKFAEKTKKCVNYIGIDHNSQWEYLHNELQSIHGSNTKMSFHYQDLFSFMSEINPDKKRMNSNIIIFQYVISDMMKYYGKDQLLKNLDVFKQIVLAYCDKDSIVIFNDINTKHITDLFDQIVESWKDSYVNNKYHHFDKTRPLFPYGERIVNSQVKFSIPNYIEERYNPWISCRSAVLLLRKVV